MFLLKLGYNDIMFVTRNLRAKNYLALAVAMGGVLLGVLFVLGAGTPGYTISYKIIPELGEELLISFESAVSEEEAVKNFKIEPEIKGELKWLPEYNELHFVPYEGFEPGRTYTVSLGNSFSFFAAIQNTQKFTFEPESLPTKLLVRAKNDITIYYITENGLKRPFPNMETFNSYPENKEEDIKIIDEETLALYPDNTLIHLDNDSDVYKLEGGKKRLIENIFAFETLDLDWNAIAPVNETYFNAYPTGEPINFGQLPHQSAASGKLMEIDLDNMKTRLWENGRVVKTFEVAGKGNPKSNPTKEGLFSVLTKEPNHFSSLSHVWMPWSIRYSGSYFIHEWPYWPGGSLITSKYSAGCVRSYQGDAKEIYDWVEIGTPILVH